MCDHCRSAGAHAGNRTMGSRVQERAVVFPESWSAKGVAGKAGGSEQWRNSCCGGGCCDGTKSIPSCWATRHDDTRRKAPTMVNQSRPASQWNSMYRPDNVRGTAAFAGTADNTDCARSNFSANYATARMNTPCDSSAMNQETGVCPAMMKNLPCTPLPKPKCFGGDCRDGDTDSGNSVQM